MLYLLLVPHMLMVRKADASLHVEHVDATPCTANTKA